MVMPNRRAMSAIVVKPTCAPILALIVLIEREKASRRLTGPRLVARRVARAPAVDGHRLVDDRVGRLHPQFERGEVNEQLERRSRLALRLGRAVVDRRDVILAADHRPHRPVAVDRDQRALRPVGRIGADRLVGRHLHAGIERRPHVDRLGGLVDQLVELRQRPVGEVTDAVLVGRLLDPNLGRVGCRRRRGVDEAVLDHRLDDHARARARRLDVGGRGVV